MPDRRDLRLLIESRIPIVVIESDEERRVLDMLRGMSPHLHVPVFRWSITEGLQRLDGKHSPQRLNAKPTDVLGHIKAVTQPGLYVLTDFHPYLSDPVHVRLLKDIALAYDEVPRTVILLSHRIDLPDELSKLSARATLTLPDGRQLRHIVLETIEEWTRQKGARVEVDRAIVDRLVTNLSGLTARDARRLARNAVYDDGEITSDDLPAVMRAKYDLLSQDGVLSFEYDTARFSEVGGFRRLKGWLEQRAAAFLESAHGLDPPRGILLLGVQGCGKSLAAKAVAGTWGVPLLRLDFGTLYNKYHGETERNLRESLAAAEAMSPCVLWADEIEKGLATGGGDGGTSRRVLATLLTWLAEKQRLVFIVATANEIDVLPPELVRKGRFDEIFFVDLPAKPIREQIFRIHLGARDLDPEQFDTARLAEAADGFSGAEIEQAVVSSLYAARARHAEPSIDDVLAELQRTRPLSVVMGERIGALRAWAAPRTVPCD